ncbi:MAG TPA: Gfo/Idh/MocA family oxidoreductase [Opitutaceae bacterium]|nr:Gfo/Idh/MocA family oxidoreductase [Opitutaceae bacterium]
MNGIAVVGYGYWGPKLARNFIQDASFASVVICDEDPARLRRARRENPGVGTTGSFADVLSNPDIGAVALATPVAAHHPLALAALKAGKHVLVEKPLATRSTDAEQLLRAAKRLRRVLMVDHTFVYHPAVQRIRALIGSGELGRLHYIDSTRINLGLFQHDVNVLWDLAVHDIAIVSLFTAERPNVVQAIGSAHAPGPLASIGILTLRYPSGLFVHINCSWVSPVKIRHMLIGGDRKMVVYDDLNANEPVKIYDSGVVARTDEERNRLMFEYRAGDVYSPKIAPKEALSNMVADFAAAVRDGKAPVSGGRFGADIVRILEAAERSVLRGGAEIRLKWN